VTVGEVRALIQKGVRDINEIKAMTRAGMGACGGKTCIPLIHSLFCQEGIPPDQVQDHVQRPLFIEVPLGVLAGTVPAQPLPPEQEGNTQKALPLSRLTQHGTRTTHYEAIVIGAGSVGTPAALALAQAGVQTLVLDHMPSVGQGSNKHAIGGVRATHSEPAKIQLCLRSIEILSTWKACYGDEIEWYPGGYLFVAYREQEAGTLQALAEVQRSFGLYIDWLDGRALLEVVPDLNSQGLMGGTYAPGDGHASPLLAIHAFYDRARQLGARFHFGETVTEIVTRGGRVCGVVTDKGTYGADVVINAAGAWASAVARMVTGRDRGRPPVAYATGSGRHPPPSGLDVPVRPDSHEAAVTEPVARFIDPMIVDIRPAAGSANCYFYQHYTGQILFCMTPSPSIWGQDTRETSSFLPMAAQRAIQVMPRLQNIRVRRTWRGLYPMTPDGLPIVGWTDEVQGFLLAVGMCGQGFMLGPGLGELLARLVQGKPTPEDRQVLEHLSPYREFAAHEKLT
jgi:sarcosine oxidase subunit beta